jgi:hypothetical protein
LLRPISISLYYSIVIQNNFRIQIN